MERKYDTDFLHSDAEACTVDVNSSEIGKQLNTDNFIFITIFESVLWNLFFFFFVFMYDVKLYIVIYRLSFMTADKLS